MHPSERRRLESALEGATSVRDRARALLRHSSFDGDDVGEALRNACRFGEAAVVTCLVRDFGADPNDGFRNGACRDAPHIARLLLRDLGAAVDGPKGTAIRDRPIMQCLSGWGIGGGGNGVSLADVISVLIEFGATAPDPNPPLCDCCREVNNSGSAFDEGGASKLSRNDFLNAAVSASPIQSRANCVRVLLDRCGADPFDCGENLADDIESNDLQVHMKDTNNGPNGEGIHVVVTCTTDSCRHVDYSEDDEEKKKSTEESEALKKRQRGRRAMRRKLCASSPLAVAAKLPCDGTFYTLLREVGDVGAGGAFPLAASAWDGHVARIDALVAAGAHVGGSTGRRTPPLRLRRCAYNTQCESDECKLYGNDDDDEMRSIAMHNAARAGGPEAVVALARLGASVDAAAPSPDVGELDRVFNVSGRPRPLHVAAQWPSSHYSPLLEWGADVGAVDGHGRTPLHTLFTVREFCHLEDAFLCLSALLESGADTEARTPRRGRTPLLAEAEGHAESFLIAVLVEEGANIGATADDGGGVLHFAVKGGGRDAAERAGTCRLLVELGADVRAVADDGETALHMAAANAHPATVRALVELGADVNARRWTDGATPLDIAERSANEPAAQALRELLDAASH